MGGAEGSDPLCVPDWKVDGILDTRISAKSGRRRFRWRPLVAEDATVSVRVRWASRSRLQPVLTGFEISVPGTLKDQRVEDAIHFRIWHAKWTGALSAAHLGPRRRGGLVLMRADPPLLESRIQSAYGSPCQISVNQRVEDAIHFRIWHAKWTGALSAAHNRSQPPWWTRAGCGQTLRCVSTELEKLRERRRGHIGARGRPRAPVSASVPSARRGFYPSHDRINHLPRLREKYPKALRRAPPPPAL